MTKPSLRHSAVGLLALALATGVGRVPAADRDSSDPYYRQRPLIDRGEFRYDDSRDVPWREDSAKLPPPPAGDAVLGELKLDNLQVVHARVEAFQPEQPFAGICSRAFSSLDDFSNWTRHLGNSATQWLAMKGVQPDDELQALPQDFRVEHCHVLKVPGCQGQRHLLILRRTI